MSGKGSFLNDTNKVPAMYILELEESLWLAPKVPYSQKFHTVYC